jgi:hypothetical protein
VHRTAGGGVSATSFASSTGQGAPQQHEATTLHSTPGGVGSQTGPADGRAAAGAGGGFRALPVPTTLNFHPPAAAYLLMCPCRL